MLLATATAKLIDIFMNAGASRPKEWRPHPEEKSRATQIHDVMSAYGSLPADSYRNQFLYKSYIQAGNRPHGMPNYTFMLYGMSEKNHRIYTDPAKKASRPLMDEHLPEFDHIEIAVRVAGKSVAYGIRRSGEDHVLHTNSLPTALRAIEKFAQDICPEMAPSVQDIRQNLTSDLWKKTL